MSSTTSTSTQSEYRSPRSRRLGGYAISLKTAAPWANRILGYQFNPEEDFPTIMMTISAEIKKKHRRIVFRLVGEDDSLRFMFVTRYAMFDEYRDMPSSEIPQFASCECERDEIVLKILQEEGITEYEYQTVLD